MNQNCLGQKINLISFMMRIEKPFDYFFRRFDVVSLVVLNEHDSMISFQGEQALVNAKGLVFVEHETAHT